MSGYSGRPFISDPRITFVVGHPGSGKSTYLDMFYNSERFYAMDDFLHNPRWFDDAYCALEKGLHLVLADPPALRPNP